MQNEQIFNSVYTGEEMDNAFSVALAIANHNGIPKGTGKGSIQILGMDTNSLTSDGERIPTSAIVAKAIAEARKVSELLTFKGVVQTIADLPADAKPGFVYIVEQEDNGNYAWDGVSWAPIGKLIAPIVLSSQSVSYQISDSGDTVPSGEWLTEFPAVQQGKYIWTRTVVQFSVGDPITSYSCAYIGVDGSGSVASVNNISPDDTGNVTLTASDVGARPDTWTPTASDVGALPTSGGDMTGEIRMNGQPISGLNAPTGDTQAANKAYVDDEVDKIADDLADAWTSGKTYAVGNYCIDDNQLYRCKTAHTAGSAFNADYWDAVNMAGEVKRKFDSKHFGVCGFVAGKTYRIEMSYNYNAAAIIFGCAGNGEGILITYGNGYIGMLHVPNSVKVTGPASSDNYRYVSIKNTLTAGNGYLGVIALGNGVSITRIE